MFIILCVVSLTLARLVQVDFSSVNETLSDFFIYIGYNEYNEQRRNLPVFFKRDDKSYLTFESSLSIVQNRTFIFNVSEVKRVQIIDMRETVWLLHDKELRLIDIVSDPPAVTLDSVLDGQFDELAPMTFHHYTVDNTKEFDTLFTCLNGKLAGIKIETLTQKIQTNYKCGTYLNAGSSFIAMKRQKEVEVYRYYLTEDEYYSYGHVELYKNISVPDAYHSETFIYDPIKITRDDSVYVPVSDENIVYVFDKKSNYETYSTLIVPFYRENEIDFLKPLDKTPFENIYSYGQIILFGTPGYSTDDLSYCGGAYVIFDAVLDSSEVVRFREILHLYGNHQNAYMGYSACLSKNSVWVGGLFGPHYNYLYDDQSYSIKKINQQYCKNSLCQCPNYLNYSKGICLHNSTDFADKDYIIIGSSAGGVLLLLILIVVVVIVAILIPKRKKSSKFRLKNYEYPFTTFENFPLSFDVKELDFGYKTDPAPVAEELCQEIAVANNTKKKYTFTFNPTDAVSHRTSIRFVPQSGTLSPGVGINVKVYCTFLCTSHTKDIVDVFAKTEKRGDEGVHAAINIICTTNVSSRIDYEELEKFNTIGDGAYGVVYIGKYRGSVVAIKESKLFSDGDDDESFVKEVDLMDKMRCPYIINFIGASVTPNHFSIATEYAKYGSLKSVYIDPKFTTLLGIKILLDVSKGMDFLHESNIIHRDIKPDNILIVSLNNDENVNAKISDFGNSRALTENSIKDSMTKALGTPIYMSPELLDQHDYTNKVDVFAYSIVCYEVCLRAVPYTSFKYKWEVSAYVAAGNRLPIPKDFPSGMGELIEKCWGQDPLNRPTFKEIADEMHEIWLQQYSTQKGNLIKNTICKIETSAENLLNN